jgi:enterochelin esterase-like enzyme
VLEVNKLLLISVFVSLCPAIVTVAQDAPAAGDRAGGRGGMRGMGRGAAPSIRSVEVLPDRQVTFRISAPQATSVRFTSSDTNPGPRSRMTKDDNGVWETTIGPLEPGAYRYNFVVDGVSTTDPQNSSISESNTHVQSLMVVPGNELMDTKDVPRGAVAQITYYSKSLGRFRRMHIYTPPGYEKNQEKYPILYLVHGYNDNDNAWSTVGRAGFILDNMIAVGKVKPMVVVMPALHTTTDMSRVRLPRGRIAEGEQPDDEFSRDFLNDIMPYAETHYRVLTDRSHRAMAGLSMGGMATRRITMSNLDKFSHICILSGGSIAPSEVSDMASFKQNVKVLFVSYGGTENGAAARANVEAMKEAGVNSVWYESPKTGHDWITWRRSLIQFAPLLFQD